MPTPLRASSRRMRWISAFAPTSTPRVGSSRKMTRGLTDSILAIATFCWLPPESVETGSSMRPRWRPRRSPQLGRLPRLPLRVDGAPAGRDLPQVERRDVGGDRQVEEDAVALAVLGEVDEAAVDAVAIGADRQRHAVERDLAPGAGLQAADALDDLAAPGPDQPGDPEDLAVAQREADVAEPLAVGQAAHLEDRRRRRLGVHLRRDRGRRAPGRPCCSPRSPG